MKRWTSMALTVALLLLLSACGKIVAPSHLFVSQLQDALAQATQSSSSTAESSFSSEASSTPPAISSQSSSSSNASSSAAPSFDTSSADASSDWSLGYEFFDESYENRIRVGTKTLGYVDIPSTWTDNGSSETSLYYQDATETCKLQMSIINILERPNDSSDIPYLYYALDASMKAVEQVFADKVGDIQAYESELDGYFAYLFICECTDGTYFTGWVFEDENQVIRYVSLIGSQSISADGFVAIQMSYSLDG